MDTLKTVYEKLFSEKTELAKHEINLALVDDVNLNLKNANDTYKQMLKSDGIIKKSISAINAELKSSGILLNPKYGNNVMANAQKFQSQMEKTAKELGISLKGSDLDTKISDLYNMGDSAQQIIDDVIGLLKTIGK